MSTEDELFEDDPALRSAVRRALGGEAAPADLRRRVEAMLVAAPVAAAASATTGSPMRLRWPTWMGESPRKTLIAAAVAFLAIGLMFYQAMSFFEVGRGRSTPPHVEFPLAFAQEMVKTHEASAKQSLTPTAADSAIATKLTQTEGFTVATLNNAAGWQFKGGEQSAIGTSKGAQLLYGNSEQIISVFSIRGPDHCNGGNSDVYRGTINGHPVTGFVSGGVVYAVIASASKPDVHPALADLDPLLVQVQSCTGGSCGSIPSATPTTSTTTAP